MGDFQIVSTKNVAINPRPIERGVEGKHCIYSFLGIPIGGFVPNLEEAMDQALATVPTGNLLTDVAIYRDFLYAVVFTQTCARVKGDVGKL